MIKGHGFLKYLKLSLIGFGISSFMVLGVNSVSAGKVQLIGLDSLPSVYNNQFNLSFLKGGGLLTNYLGQGKGILALDTNVLIWWLPNGKPYFYGGFGQGEFMQYASCDLLTGIDSTLQNCSYSNIDGDYISLFKGFFDNVRAGDYAYYDYVNSAGSSAVCGYRYNRSTLCYSSELIGSTLCFNYGSCQNGCQGGTNACNQFCAGGTCGGGLGNSRQYSGLSFGNIPYSEIGYAPGQNGYNQGEDIDGGSYTGSYNSVTGNTVNTSCTKQNALTWYRCNGYKTRMCYSSYGNVSDIYTGPGQSAGYDLTGVDIENVWFDSAWYRRNGLTGDSMSYSQWFDYWRKTYNVYKANPQHTNPFLGVPVSIFTLMGNVDAYGRPYTNDSILEFCDLSLYTANYSAPYTGVAQSAVCSMTPIELVDCQMSNGLNPDDGLPGDGDSNGTVGPIGSSWDGITNRPGYHDKPGVSQTGEVVSGNDLATIGDGKTFTNNFFNLLSESFKYPDTSGTGFIPTYIIIALLGLVIFRFISH